MTIDDEDLRLPPRGATIRRNTARVIPVRRSDGRCLLLHGWDPDRPDQPFWFTVGGGAEEGEDLRRAAVRELAEEVGVIATEQDLLGPLTANQIEFDWGGRHFVQDQVFYALSVDDVAVSFDGQEALELDTIDTHGWFTYDELAATGATFPEVLEAVALATSGLGESAPRAGLRLLEDGETQPAALRSAFVEGEASGAPAPFDFDEFVVSKKHSPTTASLPRRETTCRKSRTTRRVAATPAGREIHQ